MKELHAYCGYRCDLCPAFINNQTGPQDRQKISEGWQKYYGFHMPAEQIACAGCPYDGCHLDSGCKVRPCAVAKGFTTCAECPQSESCEMLAARVKAIAPIKERHGSGMPEEDYRLFIAPYESSIYLERLRQGRKR